MTEAPLLENIKLNRQQHITPMIDTQKPKNLNNERVKELNCTATERTLMAWIRTGLALIGFGFGIDRVVTVLSEEIGNNRTNPLSLSRFISLAFIALGTVALVAASTDHYQQLKWIQKDDDSHTPRLSQALSVAIILAILGAVAFSGILLGSFLR